jgi:hypothetical protein
MRALQPTTAAVAPNRNTRGATGYRVSPDSP